MIKLVRAGLAAGLVASTVLAGVSAAAPKASGGLAFSAPVKLTQTPGFGGFEPSLVVDRSNNTWITAHKTYHGQATPDAGSAAGVRSSSWLWVTQDGKTFRPPPGRTALREHEQFVGDEGDLAVSPDNDVYFVDLGFVSSAFASWKTSGKGKYALTHETPRMEVAAPASDRPFIAAGRGGTVVVVQNQIGGLSVGSNSYGGFTPSGQEGAVGIATVFVSHDGGKTYLNRLPHVVDGSQFCRPMVDQSKADNMMVVCNSLGSDETEDSADTIFAEVSDDRGRTWRRVVLHQGTGASQYNCANFPSVAQGPDGVVRVLCSNLELEGVNPLVSTLVDTRLDMYTSGDFGRTWSRSDVTPERGIWEQTSIAIGPSGRIGLAGYFRPNTTSPWQFRAATFRPGQDPASVRVNIGHDVDRSDANFAPGDFTQAGFGPDDKLRVAYNVSDTQPVATQPTKFTAQHSVWYAQQR